MVHPGRAPAASLRLVLLLAGCWDGAPLLCRDPELSGQRFCQSALPLAARVADLAPRLNASQRISQMSSGAKAVPELGMEQYSFGAEALHGLGWGGCAVDNLTANASGRTFCPTSFPAPTTLGASFNRELWRAMASATSTEARAFFGHNAELYQQIGAPLKNPNASDPAVREKLKEGTLIGSLEGTQGLTFYAPNVNLMRDPRCPSSSLPYFPSCAVPSRRWHLKSDLPLFRGAERGGAWRVPVHDR